MLVTVPGQVHGALTALEKYGTMTREEVLAPVIQLAEEGFGITILPRELAAEQLAAGRLKEVKLTDDTLERQYFIAYNEKKYLTGRMKEVLQVLKL